METSFFGWLFVFDLLSQRSATIGKSETSTICTNLALLACALFQPSALDFTNFKLFRKKSSRNFRKLSEKKIPQKNFRKISSRNFRKIKRFHFNFPHAFWKEPPAVLKNVHKIVLKTVLKIVLKVVVKNVLKNALLDRSRVCSQD
jgi:hypothetical protein